MIRRPGPSRWGAVGIALLLLLTVAGADERPPSSQLLTNEDIVRLVVNGTSERVILEEIAARPVDFDLDEGVVVELRLVGVNDRLIEAMRVRQRDMSATAGEDDAPSGSENHRSPVGYVVVVLGDGQAATEEDDSTPFAIRALPEGVKRPPGMEVGRVSDLALAVLCRTPDHVPDHWDIRSPIEQAPRHGVLFFQPASRPDKVKKFEVLRLDLTTTPPIELAEGHHSLIVALAGRSAGSGAWHLLASDPITVDVPPAGTLHLPLAASSTLHGTRMTGYSVEHQWKMASGSEEEAE
jgi:hypothetical protein